MEGFFRITFSEDRPEIVETDIPTAMPTMIEVDETSITTSAPTEPWWKRQVFLPPRLPMLLATMWTLLPACPTALP